MNGLAECLAFLRGLEGHAIARLRDQRLPDHARSCTACRARLEAAASQVRLLSGLQPAVPDEVRAPALLERIHDRILAQRAAAGEPATELLARCLRPLAAPDDLDWPCGVIEDRTRRAIERPRPPGAADPLWERVRRDVRAQIAARRTQRRRVRLRAALVAAGLIAGAWFGAYRGTWGTSRPPEIVFQELKDMPAVEFSPVAVLRQAYGE